MTIFKFRAAALAMSRAALLSACGGGGGGGTPPWGGDSGGGGETPATTVSQVRMTLDRTIVANGEMANVVATVTTLGANNQAISGANVVYDVQDQSLNAPTEGRPVSTV